MQVASLQFKRLAAQPQALRPLIKGLALFLKTNVGPWLTSREFESSSGAPPKAKLDVLLKRLRGAEKTLSAAAAAMI